VIDSNTDVVLNLHASNGSSSTSSTMGSLKAMARNPSIVGLGANKVLDSSMEETVVSFAAEEMLAIQTLFLLVDRADKGFIDTDDLSSWALEVGFFIPLSRDWVFSKGISNVATFI